MNVGLDWGTPAPWFFAKNGHNPRFCFDSVGGRHVVLSFFRSSADLAGSQLLSALATVRYLFDDHSACFFGVTSDPQDSQRLSDEPPGLRYFFDDDGAVAQAFGVNVNADPLLSVVLDERLRVLEVLSVENPVEHVQRLAELLNGLPAVPSAAPAQPQAPVLVAPRIFEPQFCRELMAYYEQRGGRESGFMRDVQGVTREIVDYQHKRRRDAEILDDALRRACMVRIHDRLVPEIKKAFQFEATRIERYVVACYEAETGGHFRAHRDNTTKGTAHRRFAVSLHLNTGEYEGGDLMFPEFGRQRYWAPAGGAVVFSCSLLHEATPITRGKRFVFLPFLYDEAAALIRQQNVKFLAG